MSRRVVLVVFVTLGLAIPATIAVVSAGGQRISQGLPAAFADLNTVRTVEVTDNTGRVLLKGTFATTSENDDESERTAELTAVTQTGARGKAEIEIARNKSKVTKDEIELSADRLPPSTACKLMIDGQQAAVFSTTSKGKVDLKLSRKMSSTQ